jgi:putative ABC transport system ATP-binding protein
MFLTANHINKQINSGESSLVILQDVNLEIKLGDSIAILGASGSGKTTLLTLLAGLDLPTSGDIYLEKNHISHMSEEERAEIRKQFIGFIFQSFQLLPALTALENVMLPLELQYIPYDTAKNEALKWLAKVGLSHRLNHYPAKLSGGEQQRVAIARAFVTRPQIIFADEMTGNLDEKTGRIISEVLFSLNQDFNTTLVLVTHDTALAARCQKKYILTEGILHAC